MDPATSTLLGATIGGLIALGTTWLNNYFTASREAKQWTRQQNADRHKRRHEEKVAERNGRREMLQNALTILSSFMSLEKADLPQEEQTRRFEEAQKWVNLLTLTYPPDDSEKKSNFHSILEDFSTHPFSYAYEMREAVLKLAKADNLLFPGAAQETKLIAADSAPKGIEFRMEIDDDFRRQQLIKTVEIPQGASFFCSLSDLSETQRELLVNIYYPNNKRIPTNLQLPMPSPTPNPKQPYTFGLH